MGRTTQPYKKSMAGSIGAGMTSLFAGSQKRYYILEHRVSSKYHKMGEAQEIIVDQIELGRDSHCQVRFDESFDTVSRRHAAIIKEGERWKLVQLSQTNSTLLNGQKIQKEWYLQNGDEIQLAINGPKLGFIIPSGNKATVGSIGLSRRLSLFRQQALRPYKQAITTLACILCVGLFAIGYAIWGQHQTIIELTEKSTVQAKKIAEGKEMIDSVIKNSQQNKDELLAELSKAKKMAEFAIKENKKLRSDASSVNTLGVDMTACHPYVFLIKLYKITVNETIFLDCSNVDGLNMGTGFLLDDGRFVTARHVSSILMYSNDYFFDAEGNFQIRFNPANEPERLKNMLLFLWLNAKSNQGAKVVVYYKAVSTTMNFEFSSEDFISDASGDKMYTLSQGISAEIPAGSNIRIGGLGSLDWAFFDTKQGNGGLNFNKELSMNMKQGTPLYVLGYPSGRGEGNPIMSTALCSQNGLDIDGTIMASNNNTEGGNSGGPIFVQNESGFEVIGIVSGSMYEKGRFVPIGVIP
nr:FHA domain-containing protein [Bacteroides intestinalis]